MHDCEYSTCKAGFLDLPMCLLCPTCVHKYSSRSIVTRNNGGWGAVRDKRAYSKRLKLNSSQGHVTVDAQNRLKIGAVVDAGHVCWWMARIEMHTL
jgi:hypothetical protein